MPADRPARELAGVAVGAGERAVRRAGHGRRVESQVAGRAGVHLLAGRPAAADPDDRHHPPQRRATLSGSSAGLSVTTGISSFGKLDRDRLLGVFQVDDLGDQPAAVDGVPEVVVAEDDPDRVLARVDLAGPVEVADDLDDREELGAGPLGDVREPEPVADPDLQADRERCRRRRPRGTGSGVGPRTSTSQPRGPWNRTTWTLGARAAGAFGPAPRA